jgi:hypothetical protein
LEDLAASSATWGSASLGLLFTFPWQHDETFASSFASEFP